MVDDSQREQKPEHGAALSKSSPSTDPEPSLAARNQEQDDHRNWITLSYHSYRVSQAFLLFNETELSTATAFPWKHEGVLYLVTNWHVVSGRNSRTLELLDEKHASIPSKIRVTGFLNGDLNSRVEVTAPLIEENGAPKWLEHPEFRNKVDVVCLELPRRIEKLFYPINEYEPKDIAHRVSEDVFVVGYPLGLHIDTTPIWKRATIASEPDINIDNLPLFYVDTASAEGMSGSPVVSFSTSGFGKDGKEYLYRAPVPDLLGIYSGRIIARNSLEAQIGLVWKASVLAEIVGGQMRGEESQWKKWS